MKLIMVSLVAAMVFLSSVAMSVVGLVPSAGQKISKGGEFVPQVSVTQIAGDTGAEVNLESGVPDMRDEQPQVPDSEAVEIPLAPSPEVVEIPQDLLVRLPMDDYYYSQLTDTNRPNTCGPTALAMVLDYYDLERSLSVVIAEHEYPAAQGGYDSTCTANPVCTSPGVLARVAAERYGLDVDSRDGWTLEQVRQSLAAGRPVIADIRWKLATDGLGHFVVIFGIDPKQQTVTYHDPYFGANQTISWEAFTAAWDGPVDPGDPLQPQGHSFWAVSIGIK